MIRRGRRRRAGREGARFRYSAWDGTQAGFEFDADSLFAEMTDDLLYHGDLHAALRRLMQQGFTDAHGNRLEGLREMIERLRERRSELLERFDLGGVYDDIARELDDITDTEREALAEFEQDAADSADPRRQETAAASAAERNLQLDMLPRDLAGRMRGLRSYDFESPEAREQFAELVERLRQQIAQSYFDQMTGAMGNMSPEDLARTKDMMAELNRMLEQRARGETPDFDAFMDRYGDFFPEQPQTLDELLEIMAKRMAAMASMMNSMTSEQRQQLAELAAQFMDDMDLQWQAQQLAQHLQEAFPEAGWGRSYSFGGDDPLSMSQAAQVMAQLGDLDELSEMLQGAVSPSALAEVDPQRVRELLGDESAEALERLSELARMLEESGLARRSEGRLELTPRALRRIGQNALGDLFSRLTADKLGRHQVRKSGIGHELAYETKPYEFGDAFHLNIERTVRNAVARQSSGTPVRLSSEDFEIERSELLSRASTVLMLDLSLSMPMRDNFLPAKKVTMALHSLISTQFPRDYLGIVGFAETAQELTAAQLPEVSWDFAYGTNMAHGMLIARRLLARQTGSKQIIMITDGEPTAHLTRDGRPFFAYPPARATIEATLREVVRATREDIRINVFMLDPNSYLRAFVEKMTEMNGGRAFFTSPHNLGDYVLVDFLEHRRRLVTGGRL
ncbi:vWA domain-containing protein [Candidatus Poriferisodalis sp.]|uniref:vWA domain-containing protein n=1 Tax=Candidatus Poriferisodalis sp. TaxID=3101277 RepID=UPI003B026E57